MTVIGVHASHEQVHPAALVAAVRRAEEVGFDAAMSSDHFSPWSRADGLITVNAPPEQLIKVRDAYRGAGGRGELHVQVHLSWAPEEDEARAMAHEQWRSNIFPPPVCWDLDLAETFDAVAEHVTVDQVAGVVNISADLGRHTKIIREYVELGFDQVYLHHVGQEQDRFLDAFGEHVLPGVRS